WTRRLVKNVSPATCRASARSRTRVAKAASISLLLLALRTGSVRYVSLRALGSRIGRIDQHGNTNGLGHQLVQQLQSFRLQLTRKKIDPRQISAQSGEAGDKTELDRVFANTKTMGIVVVAPLAT